MKKIIFYILLTVAVLLIVYLCGCILFTVLHHFFPARHSVYELPQSASFADILFVYLMALAAVSFISAWLLSFFGN